MLIPFRAVIRFGSTTESKSIDRELNTIESVNNSSSKLRMKACFDEAKINHPKYYTTSSIKDVPEKSFPILAKRVFGSRGRGMEKLDTPEDLKKFLSKKNGHQMYFEEYYSGAREYRLHVSKLGCFYTCRKMRKAEAKERWFFNNLNCVWFLETNPSFNKPKTWKTIVKHCQQAIASVGLDFGAVDVRVNKKGEFMIIETNSAPSLLEHGVERYLDHLPKLLKHKYET